MTDFENTPSIVGRDITTVRDGQTLRYSDLTAREKRDYLFDAGIRATAYASESLPDVNLGLVEFAESAAMSVHHHLLRDTVTRVGDELETPKRKLFHTYGATAKIVFTPEPGTPYTGLFAERSIGLARFSYAGPVLGIGIVPGLGIKLLVDGDHPSENAVFLRKLDPQSTRSVFENAFTNRLPTPSVTNLIMREVKERFETVVQSGEGLNQPVENVARATSSGPGVAGDARAPYRLILVPTAAAHQASDPNLDFRVDLARNIAAGTTIYDVLAVDRADDDGQQSVEELIPRGKKIGTLTTESEFVASSYGDYRLFFKHSDVFLRAGE